ncbi:MAG: hypothetical protein PHI85_06880 [Victivallaceae bacterium]|nr:hypothetical protein [Victivallaceae bacterium]
MVENNEQRTSIQSGRFMQAVGLSLKFGVSRVEALLNEPYLIFHAKSFNRAGYLHFFIIMENNSTRFFFLQIENAPFAAFSTTSACL